MKEIHVGKNDAGQRLDKFLLKSFPNLSKSMLYKGVRNKKIKVNRKRAAFDQQLCEGDIILLFLPPDVLETKERIIRGNADVDVVYENEDLLIVNKPSGLLSQKDSPEDQDTLNDRIQAYLVSTGAWDPQSELSFTPAICHRLDRNTSGLVIAAKSAAGARAVSKAIADHTLDKQYVAVTEGIPESGACHLFLKKQDTLALISDQEREGYKPADMEIQVLRKGNRQALIQVDLESGRFHQIRASMGHLHTPLVGDAKYGYQGRQKRYFLQARKLGLSGIDLPGLPEFVELQQPELDAVQLN